MNKLLEYLPPYLQRYRELIAITNAEYPETELVKQSIDLVLNEQFIETLDEYGCERWEKMLKIVIKPTDTLEIRRFTILSKILQDLPYTMRRLHEVLTRLCGAEYYTVILKHTEYFIQIWIEIQSMEKREIVINTVKRMIPANLILDVQINYRTHGWLNENKLTHGAMRAYTHSGIRIIIL